MQFVRQAFRYAGDEENFELPLADMDKWAEEFQLVDMYEHSDSDEDDGRNDAMNDANEDN